MLGAIVVFPFSKLCDPLNRTSDVFYETGLRRSRDSANINSQKEEEEEEEEERGEAEIAHPREGRGTMGQNIQIKSPSAHRTNE